VKSTYPTLSRASLLPAIAAFALATVSVSVSSAQCLGTSKLLGHRTAWNSIGNSAQPRLLRAALYDDEEQSAPEPSIVGMWHVKFIAMGNEGIPDKTEVDAGYSQWHADGTEILNSGGRAPSTSAFCLGVWEQTGVRKYSLNHFAIAWDPTPSNSDPNGVILGPASIRETVTVSPNGKSFSGTFTIVQYDETLKKLAEVKGNITGTRITVATPPSSVF